MNLVVNLSEQEQQLLKLGLDTALRRDGLGAFDATALTLQKLAAAEASAVELMTTVAVAEAKQREAQ